MGGKMHNAYPFRKVIPEGRGLLWMGIGLLLITVGCPQMEAERARAREKEALAQMEAARAEAEAMRAQMVEAKKVKTEERAVTAEERVKELEARVEALEAEIASLKAGARAAEMQRNVAERRAKLAETVLQKGRQGSAVLRAANVELGQIATALKRSFASSKPLAEKRRIGDQYWPTIEEFEKGVSEDAASQATFLAVKGWLRRMAGYEEEAFALFQKSRETDPDVAWGYLFEGMVWLDKFLSVQPLPSLEIGPGGLAFGEQPSLPPEIALARKNLARVFLKVKKAPIWGETAAKEFLQVASGIGAMDRGELRKAELGFTIALQIPELTWLREEVLLARARVRYLQKKFDAGIMDVESVLANLPEHGNAYFLHGCLFFGGGVKRESREENPTDYYRRAVESLDEALRRDPSQWRAKVTKGLALGQLGEYRKAIESLEGALPQAGAEAQEIRNHIERIRLKMEGK
ncbi:MAG: hypothetical protein ACYTHM_24205 [Planctomycetota bacterium]|jgi:tetratricopeptide (TPR) repeat protein